MRKKIIPILFVFILLIVSLISIKTYAIQWQEKYNVKLEYKIENNNGKKRVVIPVVIENGSIKGGITGIQAKIEYDENVFSSIEIKGTKKWKYFSAVDNKFIGTKNLSQVAEKEENPCIVYLTLKDGVNISETNVSLKNLTLGNAVNQEKSDKEYTITIRLNNNDKIMKAVIIAVSVILLIALAIVIYIFIIKPKLNKKENINPNINEDINEEKNEDDKIE